LPATVEMRRRGVVEDARSGGKETREGDAVPNAWGAPERERAAKYAASTRRSRLRKSNPS
jgi:hypothetical protein